MVSTFCFNLYNTVAVTWPYALNTWQRISRIKTEILFVTVSLYAFRYFALTDATICWINSRLTARTSLNRRVSLVCCSCFFAFETVSRWVQVPMVQVLLVWWMVAYSGLCRKLLLNKLSQDDRNFLLPTPYALWVRLLKFLFVIWCGSVLLALCESEWFLDTQNVCFCNRCLFLSSYDDFVEFISE